MNGCGDPVACCCCTAFTGMQLPCSLACVLLLVGMQAYGNKGFGEIPPGASLNIDLELLSIKTSPYGYRTKLVEG